MNIAFLVVSLASVCYGYGKEYFQVYKLVDRDVTMHRLSTHVAEEGKFEPITGVNKKNWEISYFSAYKREESFSTGDTGDSCEFDQKFLVCVGNIRLPSGAATRAWFITKNTRCLGRTWRAFSFYAAREVCNGAQLIYYAACRNSGRTTYGLVGTKSGLCGSDETAYEGSFYAYIGKTMCPFMDNPKSGSYRQTWDDFRIASLHYECDPGHELRGPRIITCSEDGRWDQSPPTCEGKKCPALADPANGRLSSADFTYQSSVTYECDLGFQLDPPGASVTCQYNGKWTQQRMKCETVKCDYPRQVENGDIRGDSYEYGKTVEYFCFSPYRLEGAKRATCQASGEWKYEGGKLPTCEKKLSCPELKQDPAYGSKTCKHIPQTNSNICFMKCQKGYFHVSGINNYITCGQKTSFQWSHRLMNAAARLPACTREFFVDVHLPLTLYYRADGACNTKKVDLSKLKERLENTINEIPVCNNKCEVEDITTQCESARKDETLERVHFNLLLKNHYRDVVPLNCAWDCQLMNLNKMWRNTLQLKNNVDQKVKTEPRKFELDGENVLPLADSPFSFSKSYLLCGAGKVMTRHRLCAPCDRGYYLNKRSDDHCTPCPIGTYQDQQGQTSCKKCHPTTTTLTVGADHAALCNQRVPAPS